MDFFTLAELSRLKGITESTARRYIGQFKEFFNPEREGQRTFYPEDDGETLQRIAKLYSKGLTKGQIREKMAREFNITIEPEEETQALTLEERGRELQSRERLAQALEVLADQKKAIERIDERSQELEQKDQQRAQEIEELKAQVMDLASKLERRQPWYKRLFKRGD